jgi:hypothetical protein
VRVWEFSPDFDTINLMQILLLAVGFIFTLWAGYLISKRDSKDENELPQGMITVGFTAFVYLIIGIKILTLPII